MQEVLNDIADDILQSSIRSIPGRLRKSIETIDAYAEIRILNYAEIKK